MLGRRPLRLAPLLVPLVMAAVAVWWRWPPSEPATAPEVLTEPVEVVAEGPRFTTLTELAAASDLVVAGTVVATSEGRVITDPADPAAGIRTVLLDVVVEQVLAGAPVGPLVIEHEAALLDGTPITVNGVATPAVGERGVYFLVSGGAEALPYHAIIGDQGRYLLTGDTLTALVDDPLSARVADLTLSELAATLAPPAS